MNQLYSYLGGRWGELGTGKGEGEEGVWKFLYMTYVLLNMWYCHDIKSLNEFHSVYILKVVVLRLELWRVGQLDLDINGRSDRIEWGHLKHHSTFSSLTAFELIVQWLCATGTIVTDLVCIILYWLGLYHTVLAHLCTLFMSFTFFYFIK